MVAVAVWMLATSRKNKAAAAEVNVRIMPLLPSASMHVQANCHPRLGSKVIQRDPTIYVTYTLRRRRPPSPPPQIAAAAANVL